MSKQRIIFPPLLVEKNNKDQLHCTYFHCTLYTVHCTVYTNGVAGEGKLPPSRNPRTISKDGEQPRPQPAIRIDSSRKL